MSNPTEGQFQKQVDLDPGTVENSARFLRNVALATNGLEALGIMINRGLSDKDCGDAWLSNNLGGKAAEGVQALADYASKQAYGLAGLLGIHEEELLPMPQDLDGE